MGANFPVVGQKTPSKWTVEKSIARCPLLSSSEAVKNRQLNLRREGKQAPRGHNYGDILEIAGCVNMGRADGRGLRRQGKRPAHMCQGNRQLPAPAPQQAHAHLLHLALCSSSRAHGGVSCCPGPQVCFSLPAQPSPSPCSPQAHLELSAMLVASLLCLFLCRGAALSAGEGWCQLCNKPQPPLHLLGVNFQRGWSFSVGTPELLPLPSSAGMMQRGCTAEPPPHWEPAPSSAGVQPSLGSLPAARLLFQKEEPGASKSPNPLIPAVTLTLGLLSPAEGPES